MLMSGVSFSFETGHRVHAASSEIEPVRSVSSPFAATATCRRCVEASYPLETNSRRAEGCSDPVDGLPVSARDRARSRGREGVGWSAACLACCWLLSEISDDGMR
ncbi:hypothetical protein SORBI_3003G361150 [Sorghum bicolor]|uniref:Uncharacterized protein n=1 Tax=Sorghum bicolor TaxID=4558 RepID=A0A1W0W0H0_SORBI|nr:hypothetical protein SORBI_3003G361150 [Sorghum bicolor]